MNPANTIENDELRSIYVQLKECDTLKSMIEALSRDLDNLEENGGYINIIIHLKNHSTPVSYTIPEDIAKSTIKCWRNSYFMKLGTIKKCIDETYFKEI